MISKATLRLTIGACLIAGICQFPSAARAQVIGINAAIKDDVKSRKAGASILVSAKLKDRVRLGDYFRSGRRGVLQILFRDRTSFTLGNRAEVTMDRFIYEPDTNASEFSATILKGSFRFISGKPMRNRKGASSLKTPVGTIGIRGTIFEGAVGALAINAARNQDVSEKILKTANDEATFIVLRGPGKGAEAGEAAGAIDLMTDSGIYSLETPGDAYFVPRQGARPIGPFRFSDTGFERTQDWLRTRPPSTKTGKTESAANWSQWTAWC